MKNNSKNKIRLAFKKAKDVGYHDVWGKPDESLIHPNIPPAPTLLLDYFGNCADIISREAACKSAPADYVALSLLVSAASLIGNARHASPWSGWSEPSILWGILVGTPSSGKSPALDITRNIIGEIEQDLSVGYQDLLQKHGLAKEQARLRKEVWEHEYRKALRSNGDIEPPEMPDDATEPDLPPRPRIITSDTTIEKAAVIAYENPKGVLLCRDELAGLFANLERHGGSDREFYMEAYGSRPYTVDRKKHPEPIIIPRLAMSILGSIQPDKLARLLTNTEDDGFAARFLYTWPEPVEFERPEQDSKPTELRRILKNLRQLEMKEDEPVIMKFSGKAEQKFRHWRKNHYPELERDQQGVLLSFVGKLPGTVIRIALVLQYLDWASQKGLPEPKAIESLYVKRSIELVEQYFVPMGKRCLVEGSAPRRQLDARIIARWIKANKRKQVNARIMRRNSILPAADVERYQSALGLLVDLGWLQFANEREGSSGRLAKTYRVNPRLFS